MALPLYPMNYWAFGLAVIIHIILGLLWYSQPIFGKMWMKLTGLDDDKIWQLRKQKKYSMPIIMIIASAIVIFMLGQSLAATPAVDTLAEAGEFAFWIWIGFIAAVMVGPVIYEGRPWALFWINSLYYLVSFLIASGIMYVWK